MHRSHRVAGALVGAAVGGALAGAFAGAPPGEFSRRFPVPARGLRTEMCGDPPGRFTAAFAVVLEGLIARELPVPAEVCRALDGEDVGPGSTDYSDVVRRAIDAGEDAVAAGALAGAVSGMGGIPMRWSSVVHGTAAGREWRLADLKELSFELDGRTPPPFAAGVLPRIGPTEVLPGVWAANLEGA